MRVPVLLWAAACLCAAPGPGSGAERSCADLRQFYTGKGFTLSGVPQSEISGEFKQTIHFMQSGVNPQLLIHLKKIKIKHVGYIC